MWETDDSLERKREIIVTGPDAVTDQAEVFPVQIENEQI